MDACAFGSRMSAQKTLFSWGLSDGVKFLGQDVRPEYPPGRPRDILPKNSMLEPWERKGGLNP